MSIEEGHPAFLARVEHAIDALEGTRKRRTDVVTARIIANLIEQLETADHFVGQVRDDFIELLDLTVRFLNYRYNIERSRTGPRLAYLFGPPGGPHPREDGLAIDYHESLVMEAVPGRAHYEVRGIGSGRVDVLISYTTHEFSAEVKRELSDASRDGIRTYLRQAAQYPGAGVRLGLLLVLDLVPKADGLEAFESLVYLEEVPGATADDLSRHIVVAKVPGARGEPSALSRRRRR